MMNARKDKVQSMRRRATGSRLIALAVSVSATLSMAATSSPASAPAPAAQASAAAMKSAPATPVKLVDINSASAKELKSLPGIGDAEAARIIAGRPYLTKADLVTKNALATGPYLSIKDQVIAVQKTPPKSKPASQAASATDSKTNAKN